MLTTLILETALKKHNFTSNYADYADFRGYIKSNFTSDYVDYANFKDSIKKKKISLATTLFLETTQNFTTDYTDYAEFQDYVSYAFPRVYVQKW